MKLKNVVHCFKGEFFRVDVIQKLNEMRLERGLSVYRLAELSGLNQSTLANTFSRGIIPSVGHLETILETMGVTMAQFFTEKEEDFKLTPDERQLIINYRKLPKDVKNTINDLLIGFNNRN